MAYRFSNGYIIYYELTYQKPDSLTIMIGSLLESGVFY